MNTKKIHFIGIGGVGMAGLALLLKSEGHEVSGCDLSETARTKWLEREGVQVTVGHDPSHVATADEVIVTPAVREDNAECRAARLIRFRGEVLAEIANARETIAVCGSHGKTTTATWIAKLLRALGEDVAWCIGGETGDFPVAHAGKGPLVVEADESDGTLALYHAKTLVVNNLEYDHPDHFKTEADYFACFDTAKANAGEVIESEGLEGLGGLEGLPPHNQKNARAAIEVALRRGYSRAAIEKVLPEIIARLPDRRFEPIAKNVYIDYAHHPTEMACAVQMARSVSSGILRVLFQPHRPSRTKALLRNFPAAFALADEIILVPTYMAFEPAIEGGDVADLYAACRGKVAAKLYLAQSCEEAWTHARRSMKENDVTLVLGAGDIVNRLRELPPRKVWIGAGSNTWKSDLNLGVEYVRTSGRANDPGSSLGIPWMVGVPGTVGGWIKMNAGAFGHSISEVLEAVKIDGAWIPSDQCGFGYRRSEISGEIQDFKLKSSLTVDAVNADAYLERRRKFPAGTYGSFFKNPPNDFAGRLLEAVGAKGLSVGGASVWQEHANVIVRGEGATASDVLALARLMKNRVLFRFGLALEPEVCGLKL